MRRAWLIATVPLLALALGGCGDDSADTTSAAGTSTSTVAARTVKVADSSVGKILVDARGMTLYLFTKDTDGKSACEGSCAQLWPPLAAAGTPTAGAGIDGSTLSTITRPDGSAQVAIAGRPLYLYAKDTAPGDVTGQNVGGVWFVVRPDGTAITAGAKTDY